MIHIRGVDRLYEDTDHFQLFLIIAILIIIIIIILKQIYYLKKIQKKIHHQNEYSTMQIENNTIKTFSIRFVNEEHHKKITKYIDSFPPVKGN
jgi:predicted Holliday junction resolvase-like endonuclease